MSDKTIFIKDIEEETLDILEYRWLPNVPISTSSRMIRTAKELMSWKEAFLSYYGTEGELFLQHHPKGQVIGNKYVKEDLEKLSEELSKFYKNSIYTGD